MLYRIKIIKAFGFIKVGKILNVSEVVYKKLLKQGIAIDYKEENK